MKNSEIAARNVGFVHDLLTVAKRAITGVLREPEFLFPALIIPVFFFVVNVGALGDISNFAGVDDYRAFQLPVAIIFAVTGVSRASALVKDINEGYFDRLLMSPISRMSLLLGLMLADFATVIALSLPVVLLGFIAGVSYATGVLGIVVFVLISASWGLAFTGFPYAIALKTGSAAAVNSSFLLFFPFAFLTTTFLPKEALTGWLETISVYNPVTYVLDGARALISTGWEWGPILAAFGSIAGVAVVSQVLAFKALRGRLKMD